MTPEYIIAHAIRYDHKPGSNARQIIDALEDAGYKIRPASLPTVDLPGVTRMYGTPSSKPTLIGAAHPLHGVPTVPASVTVTRRAHGGTWSS